MHLLASEGGWQAFTLTGTDKALLIVALLVALAALGVSYVLTKDVLAAPSGDAEMEKIAGAVQEGAMAYITRQFRTIAVIVVPLAIVVFLTSSTIKKETGDGRPRLRRLGLLPDARLPRRRHGSASIGFLGMWLATRGNVRTTAAAMKSDFPSALTVAIRTGGAVGLATAGLGLTGATVIILLFQNYSLRDPRSASASVARCWPCSSGSAAASSPRRPTSAPTSSARSRPGIPEDDPRNPATIADNVGDNVGDCAGMASDLFESFGVTLVASIILGVSAFSAIGVGPGKAAKGLVFPVAVMAIGLIASAIGIYMVKARPGETDALKCINRGISIAQVIAVVGAGVLAVRSTSATPSGPAAAISS